MSEYYAVVREGQDDHLEHLFGFGSRKGSQKANHKYVARVQVGNGWKYFYSTAELAAYKAGGAAKAVGNTAKGAARAVGNAVGIDKKRDLDKKFKESERIRKGIAYARGKYNAYNPDDPIERARNSAYKRSTEKVIKARDAYNKTLLGKADAAGDLAKRAARASAKAVGNAAKGSANAAINAINTAGNAASTASKVLARAKKANPIKVTTGEEARKANEKRRKEREKMFNSSNYKTTTKKFGPLTIRVARKKKK